MYCRKTKVQTLVVALQFPKEYPRVPLLVELRSKTLSDTLLTGLTQVCEAEAKKFLGKNYFNKNYVIISFT